MRRDIVRVFCWAAVAIVASACARAAADPPAMIPTPPAPAEPTAVAPASLPPVPLVDGPLAVRVVYPTPGALITSRDSNFIFGSTGSGRAALEINGTLVPVRPNGAFLAFLPVPPADSPQYTIRATLGTDTATITHPVRLLPPPLVLADTGRLVVDTASLQPRGAMILRPDERVRVSIRAPANAAATLVWTGGRQSLVAGGSANVSTDSTTLALRLPGREALRFTGDVPARALVQSAAVVITRATDTVSLAIAPPELDTSTTPRLVMLGAAALASGDAERAVVGRSVPDPAGTSRWFLLPGTIVETTGRIGNYTRIRLDALLDIWVENADVTPLRSDVAAPRATILSARITPSDDWVDLAIPMAEPMPFLVEEHPQSLVLTLYGVKSSVDVIAFGRNDSLVRTVLATQLTSDRAQFTINLDAAPFGYQTLWANGRFILRIRRPPAVDPAAPLRGLIIAIDPGHPPIGATGPTGLYEGDAVLPIGERARRMLEERGATVVMTRTTLDAVALGERPIIARRANAHAFVSIHLNAYPDGVNPYTSLGTGTGMYYYYPHSERLARAVQGALVPELGLRDVGVFQQSFAVIRNSWMPAVLAEGAFLMIPEQEAALRTPEYQEAYARGIVVGLERFFRAIGEGR